MVWIYAEENSVRGTSGRSENNFKKLKHLARLCVSSLQSKMTRETELARQFEECQEALVQPRRENQFLRQKIDLLVRRVFGSSSEQLDKNQLEMLMQLPESPLREAS